MKGFFIEITNNLLEPKHIKMIGSAIWEFMWCLDKITRTDENGVGWVYGGKPIKRESIRQELGKNISHISENLNKLKDAGYLVITRTPHGLVVGVNKAKKRYSQKATPEIAKRQHQKSEKATSNIRQDNGQDNKTMVNKLTRQSRSNGNPDINLLLEELKKQMEIPKLDLSERVNRRYAWSLLRKSNKGVEGVLWLIRLASRDPWFKDHITSMRDLWNNQVKIVASVRKEASKVYDATTRV